MCVATPPFAAHHAREENQRHHSTKYAVVVADDARHGCQQSTNAGRDGASARGIVNGNRVRVEAVVGGDGVSRGDGQPSAGRGVSCTARAPCHHRDREPKQRGGNDRRAGRAWLLLLLLLLLLWLLLLLLLHWLLLLLLLLLRLLLLLVTSWRRCMLVR